MSPVMLKALSRIFRPTRKRAFEGAAGGRRRSELGASATLQLIEEVDRMAGWWFHGGTVFDGPDPLAMPPTIRTGMQLRVA